MGDIISETEAAKSAEARLLSKAEEFRAAARKKHAKQRDIRDAQNRILSQTCNALADILSELPEIKGSIRSTEKVVASFDRRLKIIEQLLISLQRDKQA